MEAEGQRPAGVVVGILTKVLESGVGRRNVYTARRNIRDDPVAGTVSRCSKSRAGVLVNDGDFGVCDDCAGWIHHSSADLAGRKRWHLEVALVNRRRVAAAASQAEAWF